jgi:hypothetical protein
MGELRKRPTRRGFLTATAIAATTATFAACSSSDNAYTAAVEDTWRPFDNRISGNAALQRELVRYATLAPSSHNTQCWRFKLERDVISIFPDFARRCPAVDPDDHHLFVSLGCATENLVQAGLAHGFRSDVCFDPATGGGIRIALQRRRALSSPLFDAIPMRQCTRAAYDGKPLEPNELRALEVAGQGPGVRLLLLTGQRQMEGVLDYVVQGNTRQIDDAAFMAELRKWIRFNDADAIATGDGLSSHASGNPQVPRWLGNLAFRFAYTPKSQNDQYAKFIRSSAGIAVFVSDVADHQHWVETGRCYERFVLQATALGIRTSMLNQPVEVAALRGDFARSLGLGDRRPDLVVRFGRGPEMPRSLRRAVDAVIV